MTARELAPETSGHGAESRPAALASKYRSLFVLGRGGMGAIEAALEIRPEDDGAFQRVVALKRLLPDGARDRRRVDMFMREARVATRLAHPNVVRAFDFGEHEGELFMAMEYVEGQPLSRLLRVLAERGGKLSPELAAFIVAEVSEGLHAAHELVGDAGQPLQVVHRDVSPQNVMIGYDGRVRLLDFGVAKVEAESVTKTGEVKGKTAYMSPEQAMGDPLDRRSDLFGIGAVLFECLTLRRMWGDGTDMDVIRKLALEAPPSLEQAAPDAPAAMNALFARLVARAPEERPASAHEVATELAALAGKDHGAAEQELARLLAEHFGDQARDERRRLTSAIEQVAPDQVRELRASVTPEHVARNAPATTATGDGPTPKRGRMPLVAAVAALGVAVVVWRLSAKEPSAPAPLPPATVAVAPPLPTPPTPELRDPPPAPPPVATATATVTATATATAPAVLPKPHVASRPPPTAATPTTSASAAPPPPPRPVLSVDPRPF